MGFSARCDAKREAGWSSRRRDGSEYSAVIDDLAARAEEWGAASCGSKMDRRIYLHGDPGWDFVSVDAQRAPVKVDVIHIGEGRDPKESHVIVNPGHKKLIHADVFLVIGGPDWYSVGVITRREFVRTAVKQSFGYGPKWAVHCKVLVPARVLLPRFVGLEWEGV